MSPLPLSGGLENLIELVPVVILEVEILIESGFQTRIGVDKPWHQGRLESPTDEDIRTITTADLEGLMDLPLEKPEQGRYGLPLLPPFAVYGTEQRRISGGL